MTDSALTAKTSQTIARLLAPKSEAGVSFNDDAKHAAHTASDHAPQPSSQQPYVHTAPPHTRNRKKNAENQHPSPQSSPLALDHPNATAAALHHAASLTVPVNGSAAADLVSDDSRWDSQFLAPLLPVQVRCMALLWLLNFCSKMLSA